MRNRIRSFAFLFDIGNIKGFSLDSTLAIQIKVVKRRIGDWSGINISLGQAT